jgi:hypothetical protein
VEELTNAPDEALKERVLMKRFGGASKKAWAGKSISENLQKRRTQILRHVLA